MNNYETIIIMNNEITEEQKNAVIHRVEDYISKNGTITKTENMGARKLAYEIRNQKVGYYYIIEFEAKADAILELERIYRITDEIIKFITVRKDN